MEIFAFVRPYGSTSSGVNPRSAATASIGFGVTLLVALLLFVLPPSRQEQKARLRGRGDADQKVEKRLRKAEEEEPVGKAIADYVIINDDLESTLEEMSRIIAYERKQRTSS